MTLEVISVTLPVFKHIERVLLHETSVRKWMLILFQQV